MTKILQRVLIVIIVIGFAWGFATGLLVFSAFSQASTTVYADGFSKRAFDAIRMGMPVQLALDTLGHPLEVIGKIPSTSYPEERFTWRDDVLQKEPYKSDGSFWLYYSKGINGSNYNDCRCYILVIKHGMVVEKHLMIYD